MSIPPITPAAPVGGLEPVPMEDVRIDVNPAGEPPLPELPPPEKKSCWGRVFHHWTQYIVAVADVAVAGPAAYGWYSVSAGGSFLWVTIPCTAAVVGLSVAFVAIGCLTPRKELERQVDYFRNQVAEEKKANQDLTKNLSLLKEIQNAMQKQVVDAGATVADLGKLFQADMTTFEKFAEQMNGDLRQANGLVELYQKFKVLFGEAKKANDESRRINGVFKSQVNQLGVTINAMNRHEAEFTREVDKLGENVHEIGGVIHTGLEQLEQFSSDFPRQMKDVQDEVETLSDQVNSLDPRETSREVKQSLTELRSVVAKLGEKLE